MQHDACSTQVGMLQLLQARQARWQVQQLLGVAQVVQAAQAWHGQQPVRCLISVHSHRARVVADRQLLELRAQLQAGSQGRPLHNGAWSDVVTKAHGFW